MCLPSFSSPPALFGGRSVSSLNVPQHSFTVPAARPPKEPGAMSGNSTSSGAAIVVVTVANNVTTAVEEIVEEIANATGFGLPEGDNNPPMLIVFSLLSFFIFCGGVCCVLRGTGSMYGPCRRICLVVDGNKAGYP